MRADARHLRHDDHRRSGAGYVHHLRDAVEGDLAGIEVLERIVLVHVPFRHRAGGCFLCAASAEMDGRPGPVRDAVAVAMREWIAVLSANIETAVAAGQLREDVDSAAIAFRLNALGMAANWQRQLLKDASGVEHARATWRAELAGHEPDAR